MGVGETARGSAFFGFLVLVTMLLTALKLTGHIAWSWWWVLAPLWGPPIAAAGVFVVVMTVMTIAASRGGDRWLR